MDIPERTLLEILITNTRRRMLRPLIPSHLHVLDVLKNYNARTHTCPRLCRLEYRDSGGQVVELGRGITYKQEGQRQSGRWLLIRWSVWEESGETPHQQPRLPLLDLTYCTTHMAIPPHHVPSTRLWYSLIGANHHAPCTKALGKTEWQANLCLSIAYINVNVRLWRSEHCKHFRPKVIVLTYNAIQLSSC